MAWSNRRRFVYCEGEGDDFRDSMVLQQTWWITGDFSIEEAITLLSVGLLVHKSCIYKRIDLCQQVVVVLIYSEYYFSFKFKYLENEKYQNM